MGNCGQSSTKEPSSGIIHSSQQGRYEERKPESEGVVSNDLKIHTSSMLHLNCYQNWIGTCSDDQSIALVNITSLCRDSMYRPITLKGHQKAVNKLVFVPPTHGEGLKLWSASRDLSIRLWDLSNFPPDGPYPVLQEIKNAHTLNITALTTIPSKPDILVSGSRDYSLKLWDVNTSQSISEYKMSRNIVTSITTSQHHPNIIFQSSEDLSVKLWDMREPSGSLPTATISGFVYFALAMDLSSDGNTLATGCKGFNSVGCNVYTWDLRKLPRDDNEFKKLGQYNGSPLRDFQGHTQDVTGCLFSKIQPQYLYSSSKDGSLYVWSLTAGTYSSYKFPKKYITSFVVVGADFVQGSSATTNKSDIEYLALSCMDGSLVILSFSFDTMEFQIIKMTASSFDNDEIEY